MLPVPAPPGALEPQASFESAAACVRRQDWSGARAAYTRLAHEHPDLAEVQCNLGLIEQLLGDTPAALVRFDAAISIDPQAARPYLLRADLHKACQRLEAALSDYDAVLLRTAESPQTQAHAHANRGNTLHALGRPLEALTSFDQALACDPSTEGLHYNRGNTLRQLERFELAVVSFDQALLGDPDDASAQYNRSLCLGALGRWPEALQAAQAVLDQRPDHAGAHRACGDWLKNLGRADEALQAYDAALHFDEAQSATHLNRGNTLRELGRPDEALRAYERAVALNPSDWEGHYNRGIALHDLQRLAPALRAYGLARRLAPGDAQIEWNEALALLAGGWWHEGWLAYESRWRLEPLPTALLRQAGRPWRGAEALAGQRVLLLTEQGLGDTLQFCRYVPPVVAQGADVTLLAPESLRPLLQPLAGGVRVVSSLSPGERFDLHCPLMSLPLALSQFDPGQSGPAAYLRADPALVADRVRLHPRSDRPRVGLAWSGNPRNRLDAQRSMALSDFATALPDGLEVVVLQDRVRDDDQAVLKGQPHWVHDPEGLSGFDRTAAWCACVDLVVTVDTSIAHLAGALGRPTWVLLSWAADWRWLQGREDSPWYPHTRLFRQGRPGQWDSVVERVRSALEQALDDRRTGPFLRPPDQQTAPRGPSGQA